MLKRIINLAQVLSGCIFSIATFAGCSVFGHAGSGSRNHGSYIQYTVMVNCSKNTTIQTEDQVKIGGFHCNFTWAQAFNNNFINPDSKSKGQFELYPLGKGDDTLSCSYNEQSVTGITFYCKHGKGSFDISSSKTGIHGKQFFDSISCDD